MTPQETITFFDQQFDRSARGLAVALASNNWHLARVSYGQQFKCRLMAGLISWRLKEDPTEFLRNAIAVVLEGDAALSSLSAPSDVSAALPFGQAALIAELVGADFKPRVTSLEALTMDSQLDVLLTSVRPPELTEPHQVEQLWKAKRTALVAESYQTYFKILSSEGDWETLEGLTREGERLFEKRARNAFYEGSEQTEGGGADNRLVVDYRLAVALKRVGLKSVSLHSWGW